MPLVSKVGRKSFRSRVAMTVLYTALCLGAVTTLYPFLLMVSTGAKGPTDQNDNKLVPQFLSNVAMKDDKGKLMPESLLGKYLADKYSGDQSMIDSTRIGPDASAEEVAKYQEFLRQLPVHYWAAGFRTPSNQVTGRLTQRYQSWLRQRYRTIDELNQAYIEENVAFQTVSPPNEMLERASWKEPQTRKYQEWKEFKATLPAEFRIPIREQKAWQEFVKGKHQGQFGAVDPAIAGSATKFEELERPMYGVVLPPGGSIADIKDPLVVSAREFAAKAIPERFAAEGFAESRWAAFIQSQEKAPVMPIAAYEDSFVLSNEATIKTEFAARNFRYVFDYVALNGRALWNTAIFCILLILTQLIVNPLAAYALSRYPIKASGKILLFLLATMAFPAEVAMIPSFLLLKDLHLLNTFAALVLPVAASGYMIFLLKGFFDSLPQEIFESGQIDGAPETTMMWKIALPLSKPVLGYLALLAFMAAYGTFMYAFLVAQDQRMWTLMVWIYQLQNTAPKAVMMAALTLAALPTLIVFLFAQNVIMKGIVLPGER